MSNFNDNDDASFWAANGSAIIIGLVLLTAGGLAWWKFGKSSDKPAPRPDRITMVSLPPPPPPKPVPTPPPVQQPPEQKTVQDNKRMDDAPKPDAPKPEPIKAPDNPPPSMGSNIKGNPDGFGLSGSGNGNFVGLGGTGRGRGGSPYSSYSSQIQSSVTNALRNNERMSKASFDLKIRLWIDQNGKVTRVEPSGEGAAAALVGQRVLDRLPEGMPMPVSMRVGGRRPN